MKFLAIIEVTPMATVIRLDNETILDNNGCALTQEIIRDFVNMLKNPSGSAEEIKHLWIQHENETLAQVKI
jgi:uncharacterized protein (DUF1778 family)